MSRMPRHRSVKRVADALQAPRATYPSTDFRLAVSQ